jgi:ribonuclease BN (tRNA processing enzyme)
MASVALLGVKGGPAVRPGSNMPTSILVRMADRNILVDAGLGVTRGVCDQGVALTAVDRIFVTHLHSDHYLELGPLLHTAWTCGLAKPVPVTGPSGLAHYWRHFCAAMEFDIALRIADEGRCDFASLCDLTTIAEGVIFDDGTLKVRALKNEHPPIEESFALRFEAEGKVLVLSGDTAFMPEMIDFARGADVLVHEAMLPQGVDALVSRIGNTDERLRRHLLRSHTSAEDAGRIAREAGVKALALNHFVPDGFAEFTDADWEAEVRKQWSGPLHLGKDGMVVEF